MIKDERQFWQRATDLLNYYRSRFNHCVLTDDEKTAEVGSFLKDVRDLGDEWNNRPVPAITKVERCGAYSDEWKTLGKPEGWLGCSLPKGHAGYHQDRDEVYGVEGTK